MKVQVINLDRSPDRFTAFAQRNRHLGEVERRSAVDGRTIDRDALAAAGIIQEPLDYTDGAIGVALSHLLAWEQFPAGAPYLTMCEDDAVFHPQFTDRAPALIASLPADWDIVLWGWNFDTYLYCDLLPGVSPAVVHFNADLGPERLDRFQTLALAPQPLRLIRAWGLLAYSVSAAGAAKLRKACLPLTPATVTYPELGGDWPNSGLDVMLNGLYPTLAAFVSFPPLALTPNDQATSTVQIARDPAGAVHPV